LPCGVFKVKDEVAHVLKNTLKEARRTLFKTAPIAVDMVVANSWTEM
jgi:hypothetical protein